jgi:hypothetical protein
MIKSKSDNIAAMYMNGLTILSVYMRGRLIWSLDEENSHHEDDDNKDILSCFSNGYWIDEYPWTDNTPWKD